MSEPHPVKRHNPLQRGIRLQNYKEKLEFAKKSEILDKNNKAGLVG